MVQSLEMFGAARKCQYGMEVRSCATLSSELPSSRWHVHWVSVPLRGACLPCRAAFEFKQQPVLRNALGASVVCGDITEMRSLRGPIASRGKQC